MTDEQLLHNSFHSLIHKQNNIEALNKSDPSYFWRDGFEEPIDEGLLSPFLLELATRCGYKLEQGMWIEI